MKLQDRLVEEVIAREGGYVDHPYDRGGETNFGITKAVARYHGYTGPMSALPKHVATAIYLKRYWADPGLGYVAPLSEKIAEELFDTGVNAGTTRAGKFLQRALNLLNRGGKDYPDLKVDGAVGPRTQAALEAYLKKRPGGDGELVMLRALECQQGAFYMDLAERNQTQESFLYGWLRTRIALK